MRSFELVAEGKLTPQVQALDQSARKCVEADIGAAFARRSVGVSLEHNHPVACRVCDVDRPFGIREVAYDTATKTAMRTPGHVDCPFGLAQAHMILRRGLP